MAKSKARPKQESFSHRLARLRRARGLTQRELAAKSGISSRMIAYYETQSDSPPIHVVQKLAPVLDCTADQLLGITAAPVQALGSTAELHLWQKFKQLQKLPERQRRTVLDVLDTALSASLRRGDRDDNAA